MSDHPPPAPRAPWHSHIIRTLEPIAAIRAECATMERTLSSLEAERDALLARVRSLEAETWPDGFVAFIGNGENTRGAFPRNLSELNEDCAEFQRKRLAAQN